MATPVRDLPADLKERFKDRGTDPDNGKTGTDPDFHFAREPDPVPEPVALVDGANDEVNLGPGDVPSRISTTIPEAVQGYQAWKPEKPEDMSDEEWRKRAFPAADPIPEPYGDFTLINRPEAVVDEQLNAPATIAPGTFVAAYEVPGPISKADPAEVIVPRTERDVTPPSYIIAAPVASEKALESSNPEIADDPEALPPKEAPLTPPAERQAAMPGAVDTTTAETQETSTDPELVNVHTKEEAARIADPNARQEDAINSGVPANVAMADAVAEAKAKDPETVAKPKHKAKGKAK